MFQMDKTHIQQVKINVDFVIYSSRKLCLYQQQQISLNSFIAIVLDLKL